MPAFRLAVLVLCTAFVGGCDLAGGHPYAPPTLLTPDLTEFYSTEAIVFEWDLPDGADGTDYNMVELDGVYDPDRHDDLFRQAPVQGYRGGGDELQQSINFGIGYDLQSVLHYGIRVRTHGPEGTSEWSEVRTMIMRPISSLDVQIVEVEAAFEFVAEESGDYHSGLATSEPLDASGAVAAAGIDPSRVRVVRPLSGAVRYDGPASGGERDFSRVVLGLLGTDDPGYPDEVLADAYGLAPGDGIGLTFYPYGGQYLNLTDPLRESPPVRLAYFLRSQATLGATHRIAATFELEVYAER